METQSEASAGAAQADRRQPVPPAPGATAFKRGRPVTFLHQTGQGKSTVAQIYAGGATPPADRPQWGVRDNGDGAQLGVSLAHARALVALLRLFVSSILRFSEDVWFLHACKIGRLLPQSPMMGGPRMGATSNPLPARVRAEGALDLSIRWAPVPSLEPITLRSNRPSAAAVRLDRSWTLTLCSAATTTRAPYPRDTLVGPNHKFGRRCAASALCRTRSRASL